MPADLPQWLIVDLGQACTIDKGRFHWWGGESTSPASVKYQELQLQVSPDRMNWTTAATITDKIGGEDEATFAPVSADYLRAYFPRSNKSGSHGLLDLEVYETGVAFDRREFECLSSNKPISASSKPSAAFKAFDSNPCSWWSNKKREPDLEWLQVDLGSVHRIAGAKVLLTDFPLKRFVVELSTDGAAWQEPQSTKDTDELRGGDTHFIHRLIFSQIQEARYARLSLMGKDPKFGLYGVTEFMVIGEPANQ